MLSQYTWKNGPEAIAQHSVAKHRILQAYLAEYFKVLIGGRRDEFKLTLVDGFAGGGLYYHEDTREVVRGSPLIFLDAAREAEFRACQIFCVKRGHEIIPKGKFHDRRNDYKKTKEAEGRISISG